MRAANSLAMIAYKPFIKTNRAVSRFRYLKNKGAAQGKNTTVKEFVMHGAKGDPVFYPVRAAGLVPLDVSRLHCHQGIAQPYVETAHSASVLVSPQHPVPEIRAA